MDKTVTRPLKMPICKATRAFSQNPSFTKAHFPQHTTEECTFANTRLAQCRVKWLIEVQNFNQNFVQTDNFVLLNPPLRQAWDRYAQC